MPNKIIIADASCLIALHNIHELSLLQKVYETVIITPEVAQEYGQPLASWIHVEKVQDRQKINLLKLELDLGESSAIALALEKSHSLLIIDERKGRKIAKEIGLSVIGTLGIIIKAKEQGSISVIKPLIEKLETVDFRISKQLKRKILIRVGE